jgi:hypothetical protein
VRGPQCPVLYPPGTIDAPDWEAPKSRSGLSSRTHAIFDFFSEKRRFCKICTTRIPRPNKKKVKSWEGHFSLVTTYFFILAARTRHLRVQSTVQKGLAHYDIISSSRSQVTSATNRLFSYFVYFLASLGRTKFIKLMKRRQALRKNVAASAARRSACRNQELHIASTPAEPPLRALHSLAPAASISRSLFIFSRRRSPFPWLAPCGSDATAGIAPA